MKAVIQRVKNASVSVGGEIKSSIGKGLLIFVGIEAEDSIEDAEWLSSKIVNLRIFNDEKGIPNISMLEAGGDLLAVSQFTLHASTKKGNRPSYIKAARPEHAQPLYALFLKMLEQAAGKPPGAGVFGADMEVSLVNDGPLTLIIDTKNKE